ncbi:TPA: hypothetical protein ACH3X1_003490 [Trebouxia sp. C0004]
MYDLYGCLHLVITYLFFSVHSIQLTLSFEIDFSMKFSCLQARNYTRQLQQALRHILKLNSLISDLILSCRKDQICACGLNTSLFANCNASIQQSHLFLY